MLNRLYKLILPDTLDSNNYIQRNYYLDWADMQDFYWSSKKSGRRSNEI